MEVVEYLLWEETEQWRKGMIMIEPAIPIICASKIPEWPVHCWALWYHKVCSSLPLFMTQVELCYALLLQFQRHVFGVRERYSCVLQLEYHLVMSKEILYLLIPAHIAVGWRVISTWSFNLKFLDGHALHSESHRWCPCEKACSRLKCLPDLFQPTWPPIKALAF